MTDIAVSRNEVLSRYEVHADGALAGFAEFRTRVQDGRESVVFTHTETLAEFSGQGMGNALAQGALADAVARGLVIVPVCPFFQRYLQRHELEGASIEWPPDAS